MAEANSTLDSLSQLEEANVQALRKRIEEERQARLTAARGQAISRGLQGSSFETRAISEVNRLADQALADGERQIRSQYADQRLTLEENERNRRYQSLEEEKNRAYQAGEAEKARQFAEEQAQLQRDQEAANARREGRAALASTAAQAGTLALLSRGSLFGGGAGVTAPGTAGTFSTALNRAGQGLFGAGANPVAGAAGPNLPTFGQGFTMPYAQGVAPGGAGSVGQAAGTVAGIVGGSYAGQRVANSLFGQQYNNDRAVSRGGQVGAATGSTIGTALFGPAGGVVGGTLGGVVGANAGEGLRSVASSGAGASSNKGITLSNVLQGAARKPLEAIGGIVGGGAGVKVVKKLFCFLPETLIEIGRDRAKPIGYLKLGELTQGGYVEKISRAISDDLYCYDGIFVTGSHAVFDDGKWKRVADSSKSVPVAGRYEVVSIVTSGCRIYVGSHMFADEFEIPGGQYIPPEESLEILNEQEGRKNGSASI